MQLRPEKTILVVDENPHVLGFLTLLLETREFRVLRARTGWEAIEILKRRAVDVDLVLADMMAAGVDPPEFSHNVAVARPSLRALYMSAFTAVQISSELAASALM
jgi:CheY-like chemotaxis protein